MLLQFVSLLVFLTIPSNSLDKKCSIPQKITTKHQIQTRSIQVYFPPFLCDDDENNNQPTNQENPDPIKEEDSTPATHQIQRRLIVKTVAPIQVPLLLTLHCYGGDALQELNKWKEYGDEYRMIILSPEGMRRSWNAENCCGYALENGIDDIG